MYACHECALLQNKISKACSNKLKRILRILETGNNVSWKSTYYGPHCTVGSIIADPPKRNSWDVRNCKTQCPSDRHFLRSTLLIKKFDFRRRRSCGHLPKCPPRSASLMTARRITFLKMQIANDRSEQFLWRVWRINFRSGFSITKL